MTTKCLVFVLALAASASAQTAEKNDYSDARNWLCRPGRQDACAVDLTTTIVAGDGKLTREDVEARSSGADRLLLRLPDGVDRSGGNSDMTAGVEERNVVRAQFARFASQCRPFAPLYRQVTLTALRAAAAGNPIAVDRALGYNDVARRVELLPEARQQRPRRRADRPLAGIGRADPADPQRDRRQAGAVADDLGAAARHEPRRCRRARTSAARSRTCRSAAPRSRPAASITYASFRSTIPPPANSRFGRVQDENMKAACTNPAALGGRQRRAARVSGRGRPEHHRLVVAAATVGDAAAADRHAVRQRARTAHRAVRVQREGLVSRDHRARRPARSARRRHRRRRDGRTGRSTRAGACTSSTCSWRWATWSRSSASRRRRSTAAHRLPDREDDAGVRQRREPEDHDERGVGVSDADTEDQSGE